MRVGEDLKALYASNDSLGKPQEKKEEKPSKKEVKEKKDTIIEDKTEFSLPENIQKIKEILAIVNKHKGTKKIKI